MSLDQPYDDTNIFARIIDGTIPSVKVHETDQILSFMDVFPQAYGHTLVIHKKSQSINFLTIEEKDLKNLMIEVQRVARAIKTTLAPDGIRIVQFNGASAGQTVFHLHFHIIPVFKKTIEKPHASGKAVDAGTLQPIADMIASAIT